LRGKTRCDTHNLDGPHPVDCDEHGNGDGEGKRGSEGTDRLGRPPVRRGKEDQGTPVARAKDENAAQNPHEGKDGLQDRAHRLVLAGARDSLERIIDHVGSVDRAQELARGVLKVRSPLGKDGDEPPGGNVVEHLPLGPRIDAVGEPGARVDPRGIGNVEDVGGKEGLEANLLGDAHLVRDEQCGLAQASRQVIGLPRIHKTQLAMGAGALGSPRALGALGAHSC
jgi:hypothetical protein